MAAGIEYVDMEKGSNLPFPSGGLSGACRRLTRCQSNGAIGLTSRFAVTAASSAVVDCGATLRCVTSRRCVTRGGRDRGVKAGGVAGRIRCTHRQGDGSLPLLPAPSGSGR
jgi:hypothetical protein